VSVWAFSDESERAGLMLMAVVTIEAANIAMPRASLRALLLAGQRKVHTAKESPRRRRAVLDAVVRVEGIHATVIRLRRPPGVDHITGRRLLIAASAELVVGAGVTVWTLDDIHPAQRNRDRDTIGHALQRLDARHVAYDHRRSHTEPLLWAADAVGWAVGAGGDWRRRVEPILTVVDIPPDAQHPAAHRPESEPGALPGR